MYIYIFIYHLIQSRMKYCALLQQESNVSDTSNGTINSDGFKGGRGARAAH